MVEVIVEHDYIAQEPDELTVKKGDIITEVVKKPGGWWEGTFKTKKGMFPDNFVRVIDKDSVVLRNKKDVSRIRQCRVVFSYNQDHEDELNLKVGDLIDIIGEEEEGWWRGKLNGKEGVFPSNFVEEVVPVVSTNKPRPSIREDLKRLSSEPPVLPTKPAKQLCEVKFSYKALNEDELNLKEGDIVTLINKDTQDPGWWKGELNGKIGFFPDNFVAILPDEKKPTNSAHKSDGSTHKSDSTGAIKPSSVASQRKSLEVGKEEAKHGGTESSAGTKHDGTKSEHQTEQKTPPVPGKKPLISIKKSPSSGSSSGFLAKIKDKFVDAVDGATGSKAKTDSISAPKENNTETNNNIFDEVERTPVLQDVRANRARAPGRRLPTSIHKEDDEEILGLPNGNVDHSKPEFILKPQSDNAGRGDGAHKPEVTSRAESFRERKKSESKSDTLESSSSSEQLDGEGIKPKAREYKKVPWLDDLKANQAKRSSALGSGPDPRNRLSNPPSDTKPDPEGSKSSQNSPAEKEVHLTDMSKSMTEPKTSPLEGGRLGLRAKTPTNELEKISPLRSKPVLPSASTKPPLGSLAPRDTPLKPTAPQPKLSPKPTNYENTLVSKPPLGGGSAVHSSTTAHTQSVLSFSHISSASGTSSYNSTSNHTTSVGHDSNHVKHTTSMKKEVSEEVPEGEHGAISLGLYTELLQRIMKLEGTVERQSQQIDELKNRLQVETDMRILLQEKVSQNNVQV